MEFHEIANIFPLMADTELESLITDIKTNGLIEPICLYDGKILDGRNRYVACQRAEIEPRFTRYTKDNPLGFVISLNLKRRHLNESQRAVVASRLANMEVGGDRPSKKDGNFDSANLPIGNISQPEAAKMLNVSERRAGELIPEQVREPGNPLWSHDETIGLDDMGINKMQSHRWQAKEVGRS